MNKSNVFKSSPFHCHKDDKIHLILKDETGTTVTVNLEEYNPIDETVNDVAPGVVTVSDATDIASSSFSANWNFNENTTGYYLDVATDSEFTSYVTGFQNKDVSNVNTYSVTGLSDNTSYYYRVRAYNEWGTSTSSSSITVITLESPYDTVVIGTQEWMLKNVDADIDGSRVYADNEANRAIYGGLYTLDMFADIEALYPGWHIPSWDEWDTLRTYLGGQTVAGGHLKEVGTSHWSATNSADNSSGFTGLPGGVYSGSYSSINTFGMFWSSTEYSPTQCYVAILQNSNTAVNQAAYDNTTFVSVRLIKDS